MPQPYTGTNVTGSGTVFTTPLSGMFRLEMMTFRLVTDGTAGVHSAMVTLNNPGVGTPLARLWDWNEGGASMTLYYTFGIGLRPFNCTVTTGMSIEHDLPDTVLWPGSTVVVSAVDTTLSTIAGDVISQVVLYGELFDTQTDAALASVQLVPDMLPA